jgi:hypothetical protein
MRCTRLALGVLAAVAGSAAAQNLVTNGSFETPGPGFVLFQGWENYNNVFADDSIEVTAQDGLTSAKMFGQFGGVQSDQVLLQYVTGITPGETYTLSAYALHNSFDAVQAGNLVLLQLNFLSAPVPGATIDTVQVVAIDPASTPTDLWNKVEVSGIAPPGTTSILVALLHLQLDGQAAGATFWDNVELFAGGGQTDCAADINGDGVVDFGDVSDFATQFSACQ